jgi:hypothetical protein
VVDHDANGGSTGEDRAPARDTRKVIRTWSRLAHHLSYADIVSSICLFLVLTGGTAVALTGANTVFSDDITNGEVKTPDLAATRSRAARSRTTGSPRTTWPT